jgi:hypothetical protein
MLLRGRKILSLPLQATVYTHLLINLLHAEFCPPSPPNSGGNRNLKVPQNWGIYINYIKHGYKCTPLTPLIKGGTRKLFVANIYEIDIRGRERHVCTR